MFSKLPMYQRQGAAAYRSGLDSIKLLDLYLGHPHKNFKSIHIAGTNGKGSTSHMIASIMQTAGYKTGLYTSPHLLDFKERIKVNGVKISKEEVMIFVNSNKSYLIGFDFAFAYPFEDFKNYFVDLDNSPGSAKKLWDFIDFHNSENSNYYGGNIWKKKNNM